MVRPPACRIQRLFAAPFASYLFDLIRSPDDWNLCARVPADSGLIVGVGDSRTADPDTEAVSIWGGRYAASLGGRGAGRVGLAMSAGLELLSRDAARAKLAALAEAGRKADLSNEDLAQGHRPACRRCTVGGTRPLRTAAARGPDLAPSPAPPARTLEPETGRHRATDQRPVAQVRAACQSPAGTTIWGRSPAARSIPSRWRVAAVRPSPGAMDSSRGAPA